MRGYSMIRKTALAFIGSSYFAGGIKSCNRSVQAQHLRLSLIYGPLLVQPLLIYLFLAVPSLDANVLVLEAAVCGYWLLQRMVGTSGDTIRLRVFAVAIANFATLYGAFLLADYRLIFLPWIAGAWLAGMLHLGGWKRSLTAAGIALVAFALLQWLVPGVAGKLSSQTVG